MYGYTIKLCGCHCLFLALEMVEFGIPKYQLLHKPSAAQETLFDCTKFLLDVFSVFFTWISTGIDDVWRLKIIEYIFV